MILLLSKFQVSILHDITNLLIRLTSIINSDMLYCLQEYFELFGAKKCWFDDMTIFFTRLVESEITEVTRAIYIA